MKHIGTDTGLGAYYSQRIVPASIEPYFPTFSLYFCIVHSWNTVMAVTSKKARRERSRFTLQFEVSHKESPRLLYLGANCFFEGLFTAESNTEWGRSSYLQNEHKWVFIILWPSASHGEILFTGFSFPVWCPLYIRAVPNDCKKLIPFQFFIGF